MTCNECEPHPAPIFTPTFEEFEDPLSYIENIRPIAQLYGICKIIPPKQWNPLFVVDREAFKFCPRVQKLNQVDTKVRSRTRFYRSIESFWEQQRCTPFVIPTVKGSPLDLFQLHTKVCHLGGFYEVTKNRQWSMICRDLGLGDKLYVLSSIVKGAYEKLVQPYLDFSDNNFMKNDTEMLADCIAPTIILEKAPVKMKSTNPTRSKGKKVKKMRSFLCCICESPDQGAMVRCTKCDHRVHVTCLDPPLSSITQRWTCSDCLSVINGGDLPHKGADIFGITKSNSKYSLDSFEVFADNFKKTYFKGNNVTPKDVEDEYWRLIASEDNSEDVVVQYGADNNCGQMDCALSTNANRDMYGVSDQRNLTDEWNLKNLTLHSKSICRFLSKDISGLTVPWIYVGMVFSCFCWRIEEHWSYSINYMHIGECKTWYGVPESCADLFEALMLKESNKVRESSRVTTQIHPSVLLASNVNVCRLSQAPGEFVVTFPRAYYCAFNQGFNFAEAVNFCPADWLAKGRLCVAKYRLVKRPSVFSHNELLLKMASSIDSLDLTLLRTLYDEIVIVRREEKSSRKQICTLSQGYCRTERVRIDEMAEEERECLHCYTTLFLSGITCTTCSKNGRMTCLDHVKEFCRCSPMENMVLKYRFSLEEISSIVDSVKDKLENCHLWMSRVYQLANSDFCASPLLNEKLPTKNLALFIENLNLLHEDEIAANCVKDRHSLEDIKIWLLNGRTKHYPEPLLGFLEIVINTIQRAMAVIDHLLNTHKTPLNREDKERTKDRACNLTVLEMCTLVENAGTLPVQVPQLEEAIRILYFISDWRSKMKKLLMDDDLIVESDLQELIESGQSSPVILPEYKMVLKMGEYTRWTEEARQLLDSNERSSLPSLDQLKILYEQGLVLANSVEIDRMAALEMGEDDMLYDWNDYGMLDCRRNGWRIIMNNLKRCGKKLSTHVSVGEGWQQKIEATLGTIPGVVSMKYLEKLLKEADSKATCIIPGIDSLKEVQKTAVLMNTKIEECYHKLKLCRQLVHNDDLRALVEEAECFCVAFDRLADLKGFSDSVQSWKINLHNIFVKSSHNMYVATPSLLEVLLPRPIHVFQLMIAREAVKKENMMVDGERKYPSAGPRCSSSSSAAGDNTSVFEMLLNSSSSSKVESLNHLYQGMCVSELEWMWSLRELNGDKMLGTCPDLRCLCGKRIVKRAKVMCHLCLGSFHLECLGLQDKDVGQLGFLCPVCVRSKRPEFEVVQREIRKIELEAKMLLIPEHIVLCLMSQRVSSFYERANRLFSSQTELGSFLSLNSALYGFQAIQPEFDRLCSAVYDPQLPRTPLVQIQTKDRLSKTIEHEKFFTNGFPGKLQSSSVPSTDSTTDSLTEGAKRSLERLYIESCLLEVHEPTLVWICQMYHNLKKLDDEESIAHLSDDSETGHCSLDKLQYLGLDNMLTLLSSSNGRAMRCNMESLIEKYINRECLSLANDEEEGSFSRKLDVTTSTAQIKEPTDMITRDKTERSAKEKLDQCPAPSEKSEAMSTPGRLNVSSSSSNVVRGVASSTTQTCRRRRSRASGMAPKKRLCNEVRRADTLLREEHASDLCNIQRDHPWIGDSCEAQRCEDTVQVENPEVIIDQEMMSVDGPCPTGWSPTPPFLLPEYSVQEEVVGVGYESGLDDE